MKFEHSAGAVIFFKGRQGIDFLLVRYAKLGNFRWDYPKGAVEKGETALHAMLREVKEETGIRFPKYIKGFHNSIKWQYQREGHSHFKTVDFYLVESPTKKVRLSPEHSAYAWLPYRATLRRLKHKTAQGVLKRAYAFLTRKNEIQQPHKQKIPR